MKWKIVMEKLLIMYTKKMVDVQHDWRMPQVHLVGQCNLGDN